MFKRSKFKTKIKLRRAISAIENIIMAMGLAMSFTIRVGLNKSFDKNANSYDANEPEELEEYKPEDNKEHVSLEYFQGHFEVYDYKEKIAGPGFLFKFPGLITPFLGPQAPLAWKFYESEFFRPTQMILENSFSNFWDDLGFYKDNRSRSYEENEGFTHADENSDSSKSDKSKDSQGELSEQLTNQLNDPKPSIPEDPVTSSIGKSLDPKNIDGSESQQEELSSLDEQGLSSPIAPLIPSVTVNKLRESNRTKTRAIPIVPLTAIINNIMGQDYFTPLIRVVESALNLNRIIKRFYFQEQFKECKAIFTKNHINHPVEILENNADFQRLVLPWLLQIFDHPDLAFLKKLKNQLKSNLDVGRLSKIPEIKQQILQIDIAKFQKILLEIGCKRSPMEILKDKKSFNAEILLKLHPDKVLGKIEDFKFVQNLKASIDAEKITKSSLDALIDTKGKWGLQKIIYRAEFIKVKQIFANNGIHQSIDILNDDVKFKNFVLDKFHLDKENNNRDFAFIRDFQQQMNAADLGIAQQLANGIQKIIHRASVASQSLDGVVDVIRLCREPTIDHAKKLGTDLVYLYSIYSAFNGYFYLVQGLDAISHVYYKEYKQALIQVGIAIILPAITFYVIPSAALIISPIMGIYSMYGSCNNMKSLYLEYSNAEVEDRSIAARQVFVDQISNTVTSLQNIFSYTTFINTEYGYKFKYNQSARISESINVNEKIDSKKSDTWSEFFYKEASLHSCIDQTGFVLGSIFFHLTYAPSEFSLIHYQVALIKNIFVGIVATECVYGVYSFNSWSSKLRSWWWDAGQPGNEDQAIIGDLEQSFEV